MLSSMRSSCHSAAQLGWPVGQEQVGVDEGQVADQDRHALAEAAGLAGPDGVGVAVGEPAVHGGRAAADGRAVHDVVVDEGEGLEQLERGAGIDDRAGRRGRRRRPTKPQWQNAGRSRLPPAMTRSRERLERVQRDRVDGTTSGWSRSSSSRSTRASTRAAIDREVSREGIRPRRSCGPAIPPRLRPTGDAIPLFVPSVDGVGQTN